MTSTSSSSVDVPEPTLVVEGARRDVMWAIAHRDRVVGGRIGDRGAAEKLALLVRTGLGQLGLEAGRVRYVIAGVGPGSYAGLRIALAFAKGFVHASGAARLVAVPSMPAILRDADVPSGARPIAIMNAFAGQVFAHGHGVPTDCYAPKDLNALLRPGDVGVVDGALPMKGELSFASYLEPKNEVPHGVLSLGLERIAANDFADVQTLLPDYGRLSSAELKANLGS